MVEREASKEIRKDKGEMAMFSEAETGWLAEEIENAV